MSKMTYTSEDLKRMKNYFNLNRGKKRIIRRKRPLPEIQDLIFVYKANHSARATGVCDTYYASYGVLAVNPGGLASECWKKKSNTTKTKRFVNISPYSNIDSIMVALTSDEWQEFYEKMEYFCENKSGPEEVKTELNNSDGAIKLKYFNKK